MGFVPQGFAPLLQTFFHATRQAATQIPLRLVSNIGGLFGASTGSPPPGAANLDIFPHDHSTRAGGVPLPRGVIYSFNGGQDSGWEIGFGEHAEPVNGGNALSAWAAIALRDHGFRAPVTPGIDSAVLNLQGNPCALEAWAVVWMSNAVTAKVRIANAETGTLGEELAISAGYQEIFWEAIPCRGGIMNRLTPEAYAEGDTTIVIYALSVAETRRRSQPASSGLYTYNNLTAII